MLLEPGFQHRLHLDFETFSRSNLKKEGVHMYAADPSTEVLMLGWAIDDDPVQLWLPGETAIPEALYRALQDPTYCIHAFNAPFERLILEKVLGYYIPEIPLHRYRCTMVEAYYLGFAGTLDQVLKAIGLPPKDSRGHRLIHTFCTPNPSNYKKDRYGPEDKPEDWEAFKQYCIQDVEVERQLWRWLRQYPTMHAWDWQQWFVDQQINDRGVPMDLEMSAAAQEIWTAEKAVLVEELKDLTGLPKVTRDPFKTWVENELGMPFESLRKDYLENLVKEVDPFSDAQPALQLWMQKEGKAVSKYVSAANGTGDDSRARGMFQYKGASRTDRAGGRRVQLQNLRRPASDTFQEIDNVVAAIKMRHAPMLRFLYKDKVSDTLGSSVRHMIHAQPGNTFVVADLASIESVVLGWVSDCKPIDELFRAGKDSYKVFATEYYGIPYEEVTKDQRTFCKPPVLGAGFMLGWKGLIKYAEGMGTIMTAKEAKKAIKTFREMYPEIVKFWKWIYGAVKTVTLTGQEVSGYRLRIERDADFLRIWLPSGRALSYYKPEVQEKVAPWAEHVMTEKAGEVEYDAFIAQGWNDYTLVQNGYMRPLETVDNFCYMGMNNSNQWVRIFAHAGGVTENIVQSIAGDLLWNGNMNANAAGLPVILHVHDETAAEVARHEAERSLKILIEGMTRQPAWAQDMWLGAAGYINDRYTKD